MGAQTFVTAVATSLDKFWDMTAEDMDLVIPPEFVRTCSNERPPGIFELCDVSCIVLIKSESKAGVDYLAELLENPQKGLHPETFRLLGLLYEGAYIGQNSGAISAIEVCALELVPCLVKVEFPEPIIKLIFLTILRLAHWPKFRTDLVHYSLHKMELAGCNNIEDLLILIETTAR